MPGDTITYQNDKLTVNGKEVKEEYLKEFQAAFAKDKLQKEYAYNDDKSKSGYFQQLAKDAKPLQPMLTVTRPSLSLFLKANISYLETTVLFPKIVE